MRGTWKAWMIAGWLLLPAACGSILPQGQEPQAVDDVSESGEGVAVEEGAGEPAADGETDASALDETTDESDATSDPAEADARPTLSAEEVDLIQNFRPPSKGSDEALVTIYQFSDYVCPYCRMHATENAPELEEQYIDTGLVKVIHWDLPLSSHGYPAVISAEAAHCAGDQDRYWEMHEALFDEWQMLSELDIEDEGAAVDAVLPIGEEILEDDETFRACVQDQKYRPVVATMLRQAMDMEIQATPAFLLGTVDPSGQEHVEPIMGYLEFDELKTYIDREISRAQGTPIPDPTAAPTAEAEDGEASGSEDAGDDGGG